MSGIEAEGLAGVERLLLHIESSDRLIRSAADAVASFYSGSRFLRDTLDNGSPDAFSTGGASVTTELWHLDEQLPYLKAVVSGKPFDALEAQRKAAAQWLADPSHRLAFSTTFGPNNAFRTAVMTDQLARVDADGPRTLVFGADVLNEYHNGWPVLEQVDHPHPYVAYRVFRSAEALLVRGTADKIAKADVARTIQAAGLTDSGELKETMQTFQAARFDQDAARRRYLDTARLYLWQQHGFAASSSSSSAPNSLSYDPVGTCFALDILIGAANALQPKISDFSRRIAEYEDLIQLSVRHVLDKMTPGGALAYGLPFSYSEKGMGAFATSISGLAALVRVLSGLFERSRRAFYNNRTYLDELVTSNAALLERLFALHAVLEGSKRTVGKFSGWSTDRAPSFTRIESWVSMDVLVFAVHLRIVAQEVAQLRVAQKYGAVRIAEEPRWPYDAKPGPIAPRAGDAMQDPDEGVWDPLAPVQLLHDDLQPMMTAGSTVWKRDRSAFLFFGPPGTAKSTLAKSLAQSLDWHFLELTPSNFVDQGLELIERRAREIFEELGVLRETVILFDELDSLLTDRELLDPSSILNFSVPAMLPKLQKLSKIAKKQRLLLIFATNFYDRLDPAMVRRGRVDERLIVLPHNRAARQRMLGEKLPAGNIKGHIDATGLAVYEDLKRYRDAVERGSAPAQPIAGITPALYFSRIPRADRQATAIRSTERLAIEVAEVVGRLLDQPRRLSADTTREVIERRLTELEQELAKSKVSDKASWKRLCSDTKKALKPPE